MKDVVVNYGDGEILVSSAFMKKISNPFSSEYAQLMTIRKDFPEFKLVERPFKKNTKQDHHKGLTYEFMREFIRKVEKEDAEIVLKVLEEKIMISKGHSNTKRYPVVKNWFLRRYPNYAEFGMSADELSKWHKKLKEEDEEYKALSESKEKDNITEFPTTGTEG